MKNKKHYEEDKESCCHYARYEVKQTSPYVMRSVRRPFFSEDGSRLLFIVGEPREHLYVFALEEKEVKLLWNKCIGDELVCGNARYLLRLSSSGVKIHDIRDGGEVKSKGVWERQARWKRRWDTQECDTALKFHTTLLTEQFFLAFVNPILFVLDLGTLELQRLRINQERYCPKVKLSTFSGGKLVALQSSTGMVNHYHLDLTGGELDKVLDSGIMITSKRPCWAFDEKLSFREIGCNKGVYVSVKRRKDEEGRPHAMAVEVVSWKSAALPAAMEAFLSMTGFKLEDDEAYLSRTVDVTVLSEDGGACDA